MLKIVLTLTAVLGLATTLSACGDDQPPAPAGITSTPVIAPTPTNIPIAHPGAHGPAHAYPVCVANGHADGPTGTYAHIRADCDAGSYAHGYPNPCAYAYPNVHARAYCYIDSRANGDAGSYAYHCPNGDTYTTNSHTYPIAHSALFLACRWGDGGREESDSLVGRHRAGSPHSCRDPVELPLARRRY